MKASEFVARCRALIGQPYSKCDCIGVIRKSLSIRCQGTNWLWRSVSNAKKYRYLNEASSDKRTHIFMQGDLVFKIRKGPPPGWDSGPDVYHVGVLARNEKGILNVIHSSPKTGVREELFRFDEWDGYGVLAEKLIDVYDDPTYQSSLDPVNDVTTPSGAIYGSTCRCPLCNGTFRIEEVNIID